MCYKTQLKVRNGTLGEWYRWSALVVQKHISSEGSQICFVGKEVFDLDFEDG